jgi:acyl transferase domain-containing protein/acyl carrier protein
MQPAPAGEAPIAIVGLGCRFPGAEGRAAFWRLLCDGVDAISEVPPDRWDAAALHDPDPAAPGKTITKRGGFLDRVDGFDASFFGISPREAVEMDPQQRLLLETSWEALDDAGIPPRGLAGSRTAVLFGAMWRDYGKVPGNTRHSIAQHTATGNDLSIIAARVSYVLGLEGPSVALNTACSSSLVAVHLACQSLRTGESDLALAGGVNLILAPDSTIAMSKFGGLSPDGRCFTFDARANGYGRGEGVGVVVLKRLSQAIADGDSIYCLVRGSAVNNDGRSNGLSAPSARAQEAVIRRAWHVAGIDPSEAHYVEAHGTGTQLGDPVEAEALGAVFGPSRTAERPLLVGSVKTNIGHLETAAGAAGLIKVALAMRHRVIPPSLHFERPNPHIAFAELGLRVQGSAGPWPEPSLPALAGVSAFGFGGTNSHVVLQEWRPDPAPTPVFVFSGHGSQSAGMGRDLFAREAAFREALERCEPIVRDRAGFSIIEALSAPAGASPIDDAEVGWPALVAFEIALAALWQAWGVRPAVVVGHSIGEIAAAHVAGALDLADALAVACEEGRLVARTRGRGAMALVGLPWDDAGEVVAGYEGRLCRAVDAGPDATVLSGDPAALDEALEALERRGTPAHRVRGDVAAHGPELAALGPELREALRGVRARRAEVPIASSVTGGPVAGEALDASHWARGFCDPVRIRGAIEGLVGRGHATFVEIGPHPIVARSITSILRRAGRPGIALASLRRGADATATLLEAHGTLHALGRPRPEEPEREEKEHLVPISGASAGALDAAIDAHRGFLASASSASFSVGEIACTAGARRSHHERRAAVVAGSRPELAAALDALAAGERETAPAPGEQGLVFVFSGQGSTWATMGSELFDREPVFRRAIEACDRLARTHGAWSLVDELAAGEGASRLGQTEIAQPALFAVQIALVELLRSWGVEPDAVIGHSVGELAAACVAGALDLAHAVRAVHVRGRLMQRATGLGRMASVELPAPAAARAVEAYDGRLAVAAINDPGSAVLSGEAAALEEVLGRLAAQGVAARMLRVDHAFHSPQMTPFQRELAGALDGLTPGDAAIPMYSTVTGARIDGRRLDAAYWAANLREPVRFAAAVEAAAGDGRTLFLEIAPHAVLTGNVARCLAERWAGGRAIPTMRRGRGERRALLEALGALYGRGRDLDWGRLHPAPRRLVPLPAYPWQRERFWPDAPARDPRLLSALCSPPFRAPPWGGVGVGSPEGAGGHPLLGAPFTVSTQPGARFWERRLGVDEVPYLADHRVQGEVVFPGAAFVEMALAAAGEVRGGEQLALESVAFERMLALPPGGARTVQTALVTGAEGRGSFAIASLEEGGGAWVHHAGGSLSIGDTPLAGSPEARPAELAARAVAAEDGAEHRRRMEALGLGYGPAFQAVERVFQLGGGEALARVRLPDPVRGGAAAYALHPALLDAGFQLLAGLAAEAGERATHVPVGVDRLRLHASPAHAAWVQARLRAREAGADRAGDVLLIDEEGRVVAEAQGVRLRALEPAPLGLEARWIHTVAWRPAPLPAPKPAAAGGAWLLFADRGEVGARLATLLRSRGEPCVRVALGRRFERLEPELFAVDPGDRRGLRSLLADLPASAKPLRGVVYLSGLDAAETPWAGPMGAIHVAQALVQEGWRDVPRLWLVTRGAQAAAPADATSAPLSAMLWGLGRVLSLEHPELRCTLVDLGDAPEAGDAQALLDELSSGDVEDQLALRSGRRFSARLVRALPPGAPSAEASRLSGEATYLVTGGLGGLGPSLARWMVERGARHLALVGRRGPSDEARAAARAMREAGAQVEILGADVSVRDEVAALLAEIAGRMPELRGIVHAAAVLDDRTLLELDAERFARVAAPKVLGAWNLHVLTAAMPLDFFVLYGSVAALIGSPGQANYAAANAFLDALAHHRRAAGLPALSVGWGPFSEVGLAAAEARRGQRLAQRGVESLTPEQGLGALGGLLGRAGSIAVVPFDVRRWLEFHPGAARSRFWSELSAPDGGPASGASPGRRGAAILGALRGAAPGERAGIAERYIGEQVARIAGVDASRLDRARTFGGLGLDSLMGLELRDRLESDLGVKLPATLLFTYPTAAALAAHLLGKLELQAASGDPTPTPPQGGARNGGEQRGERSRGSLARGASAAPAPDRRSAILAEVAQISEEDAEAALLARLGSIGTGGAR